jgi:hypothetical protein
MSKEDLFIQEHFPGAMPTPEQRLTGDIANEQFFPDMTEEQFNNIPSSIQDIILASYPHLKKYCKPDDPTFDTPLDVEQLMKTLAQVEELLLEEIKGLKEAG